MIALAVLLASQGSAIVLSPEPLMMKLRGDGDAKISSTKSIDSGTSLEAPACCVT